MTGSSPSMWRDSINCTSRSGKRKVLAGAIEFHLHFIVISRKRYTLTRAKSWTTALNKLSKKTQNSSLYADEWLQVGSSECQVCSSIAGQSMHLEPEKTGNSSRGWHYKWQLGCGLSLGTEDEWPVGRSMEEF